jgi:hypothetical protein
MCSTSSMYRYFSTRTACTGTFKVPVMCILSVLHPLSVSALHVPGTSVLHAPVLSITGIQCTCQNTLTCTYYAFCRTGTVGTFCPPSMYLYSVYETYSTVLVYLPVNHVWIRWPGPQDKYGQPNHEQELASELLSILKSSKRRWQSFKFTQNLMRI